jgi:hypothetical protein
LSNSIAFANYFTDYLPRELGCGSVMKHAGPVAQMQMGQTAKRGDQVFL